MKIIVSRNKLNAGMRIVTNTLNTSVNLPILKNVQLTFGDDNRLMLACTDKVTAIAHWIPIEESEPFMWETTVNGRIFSELVSETKEGELITLDYIEGENICVLSTFDGETDFYVTNADNFPLVLPSINSIPSNTFSINTNLLLDMLRKTVVVCGDDVMRPVLKSVKIEVTTNKIRLMATSGYWLARCEREIEYSGTPIVSIIETSSINSLIAVLEDQSKNNILETVVTSLPVKDRLIFSIGDNTTVSLKTMTGGYPPMQDVLSMPMTMNAVVNREKLLRVCLICDTLFREGDSPTIKRIDLEIDHHSGTASIHAGRSWEADHRSKWVLSQSNTKDGSDGILEASFNLDYVLTALRTIDSEDVIIESASPTSPLNLYPKGSNDNHRIIIMPVKTRN